MEFFGGGSSSSEEATGSIENAPPRDTETPSSDTTPPPTPSTEPKLDKKAVSKQDTIPLNITVRFPVIRPMTAEEKKKARSRSDAPPLSCPVL
jgi:hypoxia up-regulated 1